MQIGKPALTLDEARSQMTLWCIMASPLFVERFHNDPRAWTRETKEILLNKEVIAADQDSLRIQGRKIRTPNSIQVWSKPLPGGTAAIAVFNLGFKDEQAVIHWSDLALPNSVRSVRDLWRKVDLRPGDGVNRNVPSHGALLFRVGF